MMEANVPHIRAHFKNLHQDHHYVSWLGGRNCSEAEGKHITAAALWCSGIQVLVSLTRDKCYRGGLSSRG